MKPKMILTTPVTRPLNIPLMAANEELVRAPEHFDIEWWILPDTFALKVPPEEKVVAPPLPWARVRNIHIPREGQFWGELVYNEIWDEVPPDAWHMGIGDDSLPVPGIFAALREEIDRGADVVMFPMDIGTHTCPARPEKIFPGNVSGGQVFFRREVSGDLRWKREAGATLDGQFLKDLLDRTLESRKWVFRDAPLIRHNQLPR